MKATARKILDEALALDAEDREELVSLLSGSLEPVHVSPEWAAELAARVERIRRGDGVFHDPHEQLAELRTKHDS